MNALDPTANFGFLIHDASRMMRAWFDARAQALGLTRAQWRVLIHLTAREGANQRELAEILEIDVVTLGRHIDRLERDGWLERRPDPNDRRVWRLHLTDRSRPTLVQMRALAEEIEATALAGITEEENRVLIDVLTRIKANVAAASEVGRDDEMRTG